MIRLLSYNSNIFAISELLLKLSSKAGIEEVSIGKRVDYSGRSVIVPDYTLNDQIDISFFILLREIV